MKPIITLFAFILMIALIGAHGLGFAAMLQVAYGAICVMALLISATFFWLWHERATPLALGMSLSWAGTGLTIGWWWLMRVLNDPAWGMEAALLFVFLSLLICGAVVHFAVIQGSFGLRGISFMWPVFGAFTMSICVLLIF
ncbi:hypothetical protein [Celeribacter marinus]|uniref:hypothetical protein n=1 Tax=Celeribacter marinus TaxID=1397108 RepID=UPI00317BB497